MKAGEWSYEVFWKEGVSQIQEEISEQEFLMWFEIWNTWPPTTPRS